MTARKETRDVFIPTSCPIHISLVLVSAAGASAMVAMKEPGAGAGSAQIEETGRHRIPHFSSDFCRRKGCVARAELVGVGATCVFPGGTYKEDGWARA
jgi:hypothetical protein